MATKRLFNLSPLLNADSHSALAQIVWYIPSGREVWYTAELDNNLRFRFFTMNDQKSWPVI